MYHAARLNTSTKTIEIEVRPRKGSKAHCSCCQHPAPGYDQLAVRHFEFILIGGYAVMLVYAMRRLHCPRCGAEGEAEPIEVEGFEHVPRDEPCVIVANHQSYIDGHLLAAVLTVRLSFVAKAELQQKKYLHWFLKRIGVIFVERVDSKAAISGAGEAVVAARAGRSLLYFPEGTFTRVPGLLPFKMGTFATALEAHLPVVPIAIRGAREILRDGSWFPRHGIL